jgi:hypothetical protein
MRNLFLVMGLLSTVACSKLTIPNVEICADVGNAGAVCKYTRSNDSRDISKPQWDTERLGQFCMNPDALGEYQKFVEEACNHEKNCIDEAKRMRLFIHRMQARVAQRDRAYQQFVAQTQPRRSVKR